MLSRLPLKGREPEDVISGVRDEMELRRIAFADFVVVTVVIGGDSRSGRVEQDQPRIDVRREVERAIDAG